MKVFIPFFGAITLFFVVQVGFNIVASKGGDPVNGKANYVMHCLSCHGENGYGNGMLAQSLPNPPTNLKNKLNSILSNDLVLIRYIVLNGKPDQGMPAFKGMLTTKEVKDIFAYVRSIDEQQN